MKSWNIEIFMLDENGNEKPATCFTKAVYNLHPTFPNPTQSKFHDLQNLLTREACQVPDLTFATTQLLLRLPSAVRMRDGENLT